jgi:DNA helicase-2/ATP-dependent DNA helicase PcrA
MFHLDELQTRAVTSPAKTVVVRGGPGTGKTAVVERRFVHLLEENVPASSILVIVFSSAAAEAFRRKIGRQPGQEQGFCHTFHSFASTVANSPDWDWEEHGPPTPISPFKEYLLVKEILHLKRLEIRSSFRKVCEMDGFARQLSDFFKLLKQNLIFPQEFYDITEGLSSELSDLAHLYHGYQKLLNERNFAGFPDMVARAVELLRERPHVCCEASAKFRHVLIDEFEEIDPAQFELLKLIVVRESSLFAAGDEQQRIFGFRGSGSGRFALLKRAITGCRRK